MKTSNATAGRRCCSVFGLSRLCVLVSHTASLPAFTKSKACLSVSQSVSMLNKAPSFKKEKKEEEGRDREPLLLSLALILLPKNLLLVKLLGQGCY